jgi:hypothetical protein
VGSTKTLKRRTKTPESLCHQFGRLQPHSCGESLCRDSDSGSLHFHSRRQSSSARAQVFHRRFARDVCTQVAFRSAKSELRTSKLGRGICRVHHRHSCEKQHVTVMV